MEAGSPQLSNDFCLIRRFWLIMGKIQVKQIFDYLCPKFNLIQSIDAYRSQ